MSDSATWHIPLEKWRPYEHHVPLLTAFDKWSPQAQWEHPDSGEKFPAFSHNGCKRIAIEWHRQSGKDEIAQVALFRAIMHTPGGNFGYLFPTTANIKNSILNNPQRMASLVPKDFIKKRNRSENTFEFFNGARLLCAGSNNYDTSFMGSTFNGIVFSEFQNTDPDAWGFCVDMLREKNGWALFNGTPRGNDHFTRMVDECTANYHNGDPYYFGSTVRADETGLVDLEYLKRRYKELKAMHGPDVADAIMRQELYCSRSAGDAFAYFRAEMEMVTANRIFDLKSEFGYPNHNYPVHTAWDLSQGTGGDLTVAIAFQVIPNREKGKNEVYILDYYADRFKNVTHVIDNWVKPNGYDTGYAILPWDISWLKIVQKDVPQWFLEEYNIPLRQLKNPGPGGKYQGIQNVRDILPNCFFDIRCDVDRHGTNRSLLNGLRQYKGEWDTDKQILKPIHDWTSHFADAFRYLATGIMEVYEEENPKPKEITEEMRNTPFFDRETGTFKYYPTKPKDRR